METALWAIFYLWAFCVAMAVLMVGTAAYFICIRGERHDPFRRRRAP